MEHKVNFSTQQLIAIREALHSITLKGTDAWIVGTILDKVYSEIGKAESVVGDIPPPITGNQKKRDKADISPK